MVAIKSIYSSANVFRFPLWDENVSYPANSVVSFYDSDLAVYKLFVARQYTNRGHTPAIGDSDWNLMTTDSESVKNLVEKVWTKNYNLVIDSIVKPWFDSEWDSEVSMLEQRIDSEIQVFRDYFDSELGIFRTSVDSDILSFTNKFAEHDSDIQSFIVSYFNGVDSETLERKAVDLVLQNQINDNDSDILKEINNRTAADLVLQNLLQNQINAINVSFNNLDSDFTQILTEVDPVSLKHQLDSDLFVLRKTLNSFYSDYIKLKREHNTYTLNFDSDWIVVQNKYNALIAYFTSELNAARADADSDLSTIDYKIATAVSSEIANVIGTHDSDIAILTYQISQAFLDISLLRNTTVSDNDSDIIVLKQQAKRISGVDSDWVLRQTPPALVDSDWVISQISGGVVVTGVDSDWVLTQIPAIPENQVDSDWVLRQIPTIPENQVDSDWVLTQVSSSGIETIVDANTSYTELRVGATSYYEMDFKISAGNLSSAYLVLSLPIVDATIGTIRGIIIDVVSVNETTGIVGYNNWVTGIGRNGSGTVISDITPTQLGGSAWQISNTTGAGSVEATQTYPVLSGDSSQVEFRVTSNTNDALSVHWSMRVIRTKP